MPDHPLDVTDDRVLLLGGARIEWEGAALGGRPLPADAAPQDVQGVGAMLGLPLLRHFDLLLADREPNGTLRDGGRIVGPLTL